MEDMVINIMAYVTLGILLAMGLFTLVWLTYCEVAQSKARNEYKKKLTDQERLTIAKYEEVKVYWFKKKQK